MQGVQDMSQGADLDARNPHWASTTLTLQSLQPLLLVMGNEDISGVDESRTPRQLLHLQQEFRQFEEKTISDKLHDFGFYLVDTESIVAVVSDTRIELVRIASSFVRAYGCFGLITAACSISCPCYISWRSVYTNWSQRL